MSFKVLHQNETSIWFDNGTNMKERDFITEATQFFFEILFPKNIFRHFDEASFDFVPNWHDLVSLIRAHLHFLRTRSYMYRVNPFNRLFI